MSYHGVVYIDMQPLLYPGATQIKGAYKIHPFVDADFTTKVIFFKNWHEISLSVLNLFYLNRPKERMVLWMKH